MTFVFCVACVLLHVANVTCANKLMGCDLSVTYIFGDIMLTLGTTAEGEIDISMVAEEENDRKFMTVKDIAISSGERK